MRHWILPTEKNNHKANLLKPIGLSILYTIYLANALFLQLLGHLQPGVLGYSSEITSEKVFNETNKQREILGLEKLKYNQDLSLSATAKAKDMFAKGYWAHNSPDGANPWDFFKQVGYKYTFAGENLAKDFFDTDGVMTAWIRSPTHKENIVNKNYQELGIGVVNGSLNGYKTTIVVQHFGTPASGTISKAVSTFPKELSNVETSPKSTTLSLSASAPINPLQVNKAIGTAIFMVLVSVLSIDAYLTIKNKTHRLSSSSYAHMLFIVVAIVVLFFMQQGELL